MRFFLVFFFSFTTMMATPKGMIHALYQNGKYSEGCAEGFKVLSNHQKDESFLSLYAFSCLQADNLERLQPAIAFLNQTSEARANASYFSLILMQKQLLVQALYDQKVLKNLKFPSSSHLLSKLFDMYIKNPQEGNFIKEYRDYTNPRETYKLYPAEKNGRKTIAIDEYYDKILVSHHIY